MMENRGDFMNGTSQELCKGVLIDLKTINELNLGFSDAQNYSQRANKMTFNDIFVRNSYLDQLLESNIYFLIGEKGTGKTAYATFLSNNNYKNTKAITSYLSATDYEKFYTLKKNKNLSLTNYVGIWEVILLLLLAKNVSEQDMTGSIFNKSNINDLNAAIDEYYTHAFAPEITTVMQIMDESEKVATLLSKYVEAGRTNATKIEFSETRFQHNLQYIKKGFSDAIEKLKLNKDIVLFIDGIDIRPDTIHYMDYLECIKGLVQASWGLNTSLFANVRDTKGQLRIVLLLRPDIFHSLDLQNATNKLLDNSVFLDWRTTYDEYRTSPLYEVAKKLLAYKQNHNKDDIFEYYFPWSFPVSERRNGHNAFKEFLRISLSRPRDILVIMQYIQRKMKRDGLGLSNVFSQEVFESNEFQNNYSEYFMSSLKDQLSFYYSNVDFEHFLRLFDFFENAYFTYDEYIGIYEKFIGYVNDNAENMPKFLDDKQKLLQLLYDSNLIVAIEADNGRNFFHFAYRERDSSNINPKVRKGDNITYRFHYGLYKKAKMGRY